MASKSLFIIAVICWVYVGTLIAYIFLRSSQQPGSLLLVGLGVIAFLLGLITLPLAVVNFIKERKDRKNTQL